MKVEYTDTGITVKSVVRKKHFPYEDVSVAYLRLQEIEANMCCGRANFDRCFLVMVVKDKEEVVEMESKAQVKYALDMLSKHNPNIHIGKPKD